MQFCSEKKRNVLFLILCMITFSSTILCIQHIDADDLKGLNAVPSLISMPGYKLGTGICFSSDNTEKIKFINQTIGQNRAGDTTYKSEVLIIHERLMTHETTLYHTAAPHVEFHMISPVKYRVRLHNVKESFPLIVSEQFHNGWRAYFVSFTSDLHSVKAESISKYKILAKNENDQASTDELRTLIGSQLVTYVGDGKIKERKQYRYLYNGVKAFDHIDNFTIDFISKNIKGTVQNDNLPEGAFYETWFAGGFATKALNFDMPQWSFKGGLNKSSVEIPDLYHWKVNGYANSWWINTELLRMIKSNSRADQLFYKQNADGSMDFEIVIEFWNQRIFYIGIGVSMAAFLFCLMYLIYGWRKRRLINGGAKIYEG
ncbi:MAG: hypothetical protein HQK96_11335 [Nitrospirae bacterium]|nr:hypothetical protein [Nitrospirota bacterium]